jgi:hypothetical protein
MTDTASEHSAALLEQGFTVFADVLSPAQVAVLRDGLEAIYTEHGRPPAWDPGYRPFADQVFTCAAGFVARSLFAHRPDWVDLLIRPEVVAALRLVLGPDMVIEVAGSVIADRSRPFFRWHTHVDGVDDRGRWETGEWPLVPDARRVMTLLYLQDLDDDSAPLRIARRRVGDPTGPLQDIDLEHWDGQVELRVRAGTIVVLEQCTWHAIPPTRSDELRMFIGINYAQRSTAPAAWVDERMPEYAPPGSLLQSLLR